MNIDPNTEEGSIQLRIVTLEAAIKAVADRQVGDLGTTIMHLAYRFENYLKKGEI